MLRTLAASGSFHVALLDGVTGSGKTEVYFEAIAETIRRGKQTLILMPEIALTGQFLDRFSQRFGVRPIEWHSELTPRTRARNWAAISEGKAPVVVGARSALFMPYADLGLIVVDEEHDQAYKQDDGAHYHARDMAVVRAHIAKIPIVLASATPSVESEVNARKGRYQRVALPSRFGGQHMPHIEAIDLRREPPPRGRFISPRLAEQIQHRGGAARAGAVVPQPPRLRAADAVPGLRPSLCLHYLRRLAGRSPLSPASGLPSLRLLDAAPAYLSELRGRRIARCASVPAWSGCRRRRPTCSRMRAPWCCRAISSPRSRPCAANSTRSPRAASTSSSARSWWRRDTISRGSIWSAWSTPISACSNGDPRAAERTFQLLNQVIGRAGRDQGRGVGYLQTHQPEHPVMKALIANDREAFYASEIELARAHRLSAVRPPGEPDHLRRRPSHRGRLCAQARVDRPAR